MESEKEEPRPLARHGGVDLAVPPVAVGPPLRRTSGPMPFGNTRVVAAGAMRARYRASAWLMTQHSVEARGHFRLVVGMRGPSKP